MCRGDVNGVVPSVLRSGAVPAPMYKSVPAAVIDVKFPSGRGYARKDIKNVIMSDMFTLPVFGSTLYTKLRR